MCQRYSVQLSTVENGVTVGVPIDDGQLEVTMLDPHLRIPLVADPTQPGKLEATFNLPDRHGVFTFRFDYRRPGYSFVGSEVLVSVAPPRHDQFDRFIKGATPFYAGAASVSLATLSLIAVWVSL